MKKPIILLIFLSISITSFCQSANHNVFASSGNTASNDKVTLDWTIGESFILQLTDNSQILAQGFHQSEISQVSSVRKPKANFEVKIYPNPVVEKLLISPENASRQSLWKCEVYNLSGIRIFQLSTKTKPIEIDFRNFGPSQYLLKISDAEGHSKTTAIIKQ